MTAPNRSGATSLTPAEDLVSPPRSSPAETAGWGWKSLTAGSAVLNESQNAIEISPPLRDWLGIAETTILTPASFWESFWARVPAWQEVVQPQIQSEETFNRLELTLGTEAARQWFTLELVRQGSILFLRLESAAPPLEDLLEAGADLLNDSQPGPRQLFVRCLRAEGQLQKLGRYWPGVIFSQRADFSFQFVSPKIEELTGISVEEWKQAPHRFWQVIHEGDANDLHQQIRQAAETPEGVATVFRIRHFKTGRVSYILEHREAARTEQGLILGYEGVWLDVTRQTIAEKRLSTAAWKETLSVLTMGLAHDFNNIMAGIHSLSEAFQAQVGPEHPFAEGLSLIQRNSLLASQLIHRILNLHHGKLGEKAYHNTNELVADILELIRKIVPRHTQIETSFAAEQLPIYADAVEFRQVLINLALNSVDAMSQGGRLRFRVSRHESYPALQHVQGTLPRLPSVCVATEDTGCGIPGQHLANVFDPFFTTKSLEKGSGLGLYNARLFAEKHYGAISIDSKEKVGTTICVWLPEADFTETERSDTTPASERRTLLVYGPGGQARDSLAEFLRRSGFSVVVASLEDNARRSLSGREYVAGGVFLLANGQDRRYLDLAAAARQDRLKVVVQATGCNQDELEAELLELADLVVPTDLTRPEMLTRIQQLFGLH